MGVEYLVRPDSYRPPAPADFAFIWIHCEHRDAGGVLRLDADLITYIFAAGLYTHLDWLN